MRYLWILLLTLALAAPAAYAVAADSTGAPAAAAPHKTKAAKTKGVTKSPGGYSGQGPCFRRQNPHARYRTPGGKSARQKSAVCF